jgi:hypothetical protein
MTFEGKPGAPLTMTPELETEVFSGQRFLAEHGLESIADFDVKAHGLRIPLSRALEVCTPLVGMVESLSTSLRDVPGHTDIIKTALVSAASRADTQLPDEAKKK